jgi:carbonic anhydrase
MSTRSGRIRDRIVIGGRVAAVVAVEAVLVGGCRIATPATPADFAAFASADRSAQTAPTAVVAPISARPAEWSYSGDDGPERWASLSSAYAACGRAGTQSPIDLDGKEEAASKVVVPKISYRRTGLRLAHHQHVTDIVDNGHTLQVGVDAGSRLETALDVYELKQFHYHLPSEHTLDGHSFPMEVHFVHQSTSGRFAVVAGFVEVGVANPDLARLIEHFPARPGESVHRPDVAIDPAAHLSAEIPAFAYRGSLTTPPCTEQVEWFVLRKPRSASQEQIASFAAKLAPNNRPVQPRGAREVAGQALTREEAD